MKLEHCSQKLVSQSLIVPPCYFAYRCGDGNLFSGDQSVGEGSQGEQVNGDR